MTELPQPLTPADCNLRDFLFMPLDVARLRDSKGVTILTGDEFRCSVLLWCASWHQVPSASLPDDDIELSQIAGFGRVIKAWKKVRAGALRGWIKCSDGRLYHPVVAEKANEAWAGRVKYREEKEKERIRKAEARAAKKAEEDAAKEAFARATRNSVPELSAGQNSNVRETNPDCPPDFALRGTVDSGEGQWTVDSGQLTPNADDSSGGTVYDQVDPPRAAPLPLREAPPLSDDPAIQLAVRLRRLGVEAQFTHPAVQDWVKREVPPEVLEAAITKARVTKGDAKIPPGYLVGIVNDLLDQLAQANGAPARPAATAKPRKPTGSEPKGVDETYPEYDARIRQAEIDRRKGQP